MEQAEINRRIEMLMRSIKHDWKGAGLIDQEYHFPATAERIIETHLRAAIGVGCEASVESLVKEINSIGVFQE